MRVHSRDAPARKQRSDMSEAHHPSPLSGRLALDLTQGIAGPYAGRLLAEHGCRVIKVEPPDGDWIRQIGSGPGGTSINFLYYNLGKESVTLDLKTASGVGAALAIAERADVVLESARPGAMERLGLGFDAVKARNARVVYLSVSGFGLTGRRARDPMTDTVAQAYSGMMSINKGTDGVPHKIQTTVVDAITGLYAFQAVSMALMAGGPARRLDVSLMQSAAAIMGPKVMEFAHHGFTPATPNAPAGSYRTADGWVAITLVRESHFVGMAAAVGRPELSDDPRFATFAARLANLDALVAILSEVLAGRTTADWLAIFAEKGVLASSINDFGDWLAEPHVIESGAAPVTAVGEGAESPTPRTPGRAAFQAPAPAAGADTDRVLAEFAVRA
jgi:CoA:oxalate CoA-transferase